MEMDFHGMKRKRLQALCKKHGIPANLKNKEMADRLSFILKGKEIEDPVGSGNAGTKKNTPRCVGGKDKNVEMIDLVTPGPGLEERSVISAKNLKGSEIERLEFETNLSLEITRGDFGICGVEEDMKSGLNEEQVVNSQGGLHSAPVVAALEEFSNPLVEGEVEKLDDKNYLEDVCENGNGRDEAAEQGDHNSLQGSNMKDVNVLHVSQEESGYPMVEEDEAAEQGDHSSPQVSNMKDMNVIHVSQVEPVYPMVEEGEDVEQAILNSPQASNMKNVNVLHVSQEESGYPMVEEDEAAEQGDHRSPQGSNMKDMNVIVSQEEPVYPMVEEDEVVEHGSLNSPQASNMKNVNVLHVSQEESGHPVVEEDEAAEQGDYNSPQGSNMRDKNILHVSHEESVYPMVEDDEAVEQGNHNSSQASNMKDVNVLHVSQEEFGLPLVEDDEVVEPGSQNSPQASNMKDVNALHVFPVESVYPIVEDDEAVEPGNHNSPQASNMKDVNVLHGSQEESGHPLVEEDEAAEQGDYNSPQESNMRDMNVLHVSHEECVYPMVEDDEVVEPGSQNSPQASNMKDVNALHVSPVESVYPMVEDDEAVEEGNQNSPQASNMTDVNALHVSPEESGYPIVEEVQKSDDNIYNGSVYNLKNSGSEVDAKDTDGKTNLTAEHFVDDVPSSLNKYSVGTPDQFQRTYPENEVKSSGLNIHQDTCEEELKTSQKTGPIADPGECIGFSPNNLEASAIKGFQAETYFDPSTLGDVEERFDIGICVAEENMLNDVNEEQVDDSQKVIQAASSVMDLNNEDLVQVASVEVGDNLLEEEVEKSGLVADSEECIGFLPNNLEPSATKGFEAESMQSDQMEKEYSQEMDLNKEDLVHVASVEVGDDFLEEEVEKSGLVADSEECIGFLPNNLEPSATKDFGAESMQSDQMEKEYSQEMDLNKEDLVHVPSVEVGDNLLEEEVEKSGLVADSEECIGFLPNNPEPSATKGFEAESMQSDQMEKEYGQEVLHMANELQIAMEESDTMEEVTRLFDNSDDHDDPGGTEAEESGYPMVEEVQKFDDNIYNGSVYNLKNSGSEVNGSQQVIHAASSVMVLNNKDLLQVASVEVGDHMLEGEVEKSGLIADSEECIGVLPNNLEPSATKGFEAESMQSDQMEKEYSQEVLHMANELQRAMEESDPMEEVTRLFDNSDDHDDAGGTEAEEDKSQHYINSNMDSIEKYLLNDFQSIDDADGQNSDEKPDEYAPTVPQSVEMKSCTFNLQQISASDTVSGDEGTFQEKLETPTKCTLIPSSEDNVIFYPNLESSMKKELIVKSLPMKRARDVLGASDMKENIKIAKEQVGTIISRSAFPKRKPLQDLQQN